MLLYRCAWVDFFFFYFYTLLRLFTNHSWFIPFFTFHHCNIHIDQILFLRWYIDINFHISRYIFDPLHTSSNVSYLLSPSETTHMRHNTPHTYRNYFSNIPHNKCGHLRYVIIFYCPTSNFFFPLAVAVAAAYCYRRYLFRWYHKARGAEPDI